MQFLIKDKNKTFQEIIFPHYFPILSPLCYIPECLREKLNSKKRQLDVLCPCLPQFLELRFHFSTDQIFFQGKISCGAFKGEKKTHQLLHHM